MKCEGFFLCLKCCEFKFPTSKCINSHELKWSTESKICSRCSTCYKVYSCDKCQYNLCLNCIDPLSESTPSYLELINDEKILSIDKIGNVAVYQSNFNIEQTFNIGGDCIKRFIVTSNNSFVCVIGDRNLKIGSLSKSAKTRFLHEPNLWLPFWKKVTSLVDLGNDTFALSANESNVYIYNIKGEFVKSLETPSVCLYNYHEGLLACGGKNILLFWNINNDKETDRSLYDQGNTIKTVIKLNENQFATGGTDKVCKIWNIDNLNCIKELKGHFEEITNIIKLVLNKIATSSADKSVRIWDYKKGECLLVLQVDEEINSLFKMNVSIIAVGSSSKLTYFKLNDNFNGLINKYNAIEKNEHDYRMFILINK